MNYRHAYHAGNFADVVKHVIVSRIVEYLKRKEQAFRVIDTHAGIGLYDLQGTEAGKTGEWQRGIDLLIKALDDNRLPAPAQELLQPYIEAVQSVNPQGGLRHYPGSPLLVRHLMRKQDRLSALELHPQDAKRLAKLFAGDYQARIIELDGWLAPGAHLPPKEKRGMVLIDPPFEQAGDFERMVDALIKGHKRFAGGTFVLWYPIKDYRDVSRFHKMLKESAIPKIAAIDFSIRKPSSEPRLDGTGMVVVNPPYLLEEEMRILLPSLHSILREENTADCSFHWIRSE